LEDVVTIDGIRCYAPALALGGVDYPVEIYDRLCRLEEGHFWFQARNRIILRMFHRHLAQLVRPRVLEIGCGTGYVLRGLAAENRYELMGAEAHVAGLRHARSRLPSVELVQADARDLPYQSAFDAIGAFDVIEHISEDDVVLRSIWRALKPGGIVIVTVPQHRWLWSSIDEQAGHKRRYTRPELSVKLVSAGFERLHATSFVTALLPVLYAARLAKRRRKIADFEFDLRELEISRLTNAICAAAMRIDEALIRIGMSLPLGGSLLAVARKLSNRSGQMQIRSH
jgi:SAM-dependent methyltransferase